MNIARLWALYGAQFWRILANCGIYGHGFLGRGIGRFYGLDYALRDRGWLDEYAGKPGTELFVARDNN